jgi:hypothetical protein
MIHRHLTVSSRFEGPARKQQEIALTQRRP